MLKFAKIAKYGDVSSGVFDALVLNKWQKGISSI